jgi:hypothetical protein
VNDRVQEYRRLARECLHLVSTVTTEEARRALIEMARIWSRLAEEVEAGAPPSAPIALKADNPPQPVAQQQEQVQPKKGEND